LSDLGGEIVVEAARRAVHQPSELAKTAYNVKLTQKGKALVTAWKEGNLGQLSTALDNVSSDQATMSDNK
jgi:hypothetical protein